jgi:PEP-CTERM/exosortase A-associated glycosyltransferase
MKVLHVLDHSLPLQSGYATRSHSILRALRERGVETVQITSPKHTADGLREETVNGIEYLRSEPVAGEGVTAQLACIRSTRLAVKRVIALERPDIVHAHSPCLNGVAVFGLHVPVIYEMRSSWEDAAVSSGKTSEDSIRYRLSRALETFVIRNANAAVVICEGLARELERRGVAHKVHVVGNAIDPTHLVPAMACDVARVKRQLGLDGKTVLGFFGSFFAWEGLDVLLNAFPSIVARHPHVVLVLVGGGEDEQKLRSMAGALNIAERVRFVGRVAHAEVASYYGAADVMVFPRKRLRLTEMVTPLKPIEAMHLGVLVAASDVGGHRELITHNRTGCLFPADDPAALADSLSRLLDQPERWQIMRDAAHRYVLEQRTWQRMAERYEALYSEILRR